MQTSRRRKAEQRRDQLIDTALAVFAEKGVHAATVKDLSASRQACCITTSAPKGTCCTPRWRAATTCPNCGASPHLSASLT
jgi:hypothetical protein